MRILKEPFGKMKNGDPITLYTIESEKLTLAVTDIGACIVRLLVPDAKGCADDVVLGFDRGEDYLDNPDYFGAVVGPSANRVSEGRVVIDGVTCRLPLNIDGGNLHTDNDSGLHKQLWRAAENTDGITFALDVPDGMWGLPGNRRFQVTYTLTDDHTVQLSYRGESDKRTLMNLTNHSYFNLSGHGLPQPVPAMKSAMDHVLMLQCAQYTPTDERLMTTGLLADVRDTPFDFLTPHALSQRIDEPHPQLGFGKGYDHNFCIDGKSGTLRHFATLEDPASGRVMKVSTTLPGVQCYGGNFIHTQKGKYGATYGYRCALCLETQYYPDAVNKEHFASPLFGADTVMESATVFSFEAS